MHVVTVRIGEKFGEEYETALRAQVARHMGADLQVVRESGFSGYWSKMELFRPGFPFRPCVFFDLDTFLVDDCRGLFEFDTGDLWLIRDLGNPNRSNSGVMVIPENTDETWAASKRWNRPYDGDFLARQPHRLLQDRFAGIVSYKYQCRVRPNQDRPKYPDGTRVICFHGAPKPHEATDWAGEYWRALT